MYTITNFKKIIDPFAKIIPFKKKIFVCNICKKFLFLL